jgi:hypothetical protein
MSEKKQRRRRSPRRLNDLQKKARGGFRGFPVATVAAYGPDNTFASKVAVGIVLEEDAEPAFLERWFSQGEDVRRDATIRRGILDFIAKHGVKSVIMADGIIGCPHEEGIHYPEGETCPYCPYWANRDRWTGELLEESDREDGMVAGACWYRAEQWDRLLEIAVDGDSLEQTYADWLANAEKALGELSELGVVVEKIDVDVEELLAWCRAQGREVDSAARAAYALEMLQQRPAGQGGEGG